MRPEWQMIAITTRSSINVKPLVDTCSFFFVIKGAKKIRNRSRYIRPLPEFSSDYHQSNSISTGSQIHLAKSSGQRTNSTCPSPKAML